MILVVLAIIALPVGLFLFGYLVVNPLAAGMVDGSWGNRMSEEKDGTGWLRSKVYNYAWNYGAHDKGLDPFLLSVVTGVLFIGGLIALVAVAARAL